MAGEGREAVGGVFKGIMLILLDFTHQSGMDGAGFRQNSVHRSVPFLHLSSASLKVGLNFPCYFTHLTFPICTVGMLIVSSSWCPRVNTNT